MPKKNPKHRKRSHELPDNLPSLGKRKLEKAKGIVKKTCDIDGCKSPSIHSLSLVEYESAVKKAGLKLDIKSGARKFNICKEHYKKIKTFKKKEDKFTRPSFNEFKTKVPKRNKTQKLLE
ncbi:MAG: hypothetical protein ACTSU2_02295 [Promethearchaeota archaeon]